MSQQHPVIDHSAIAEEVNAAINYTMYAVFRAQRLGSAAPRDVLDAVAG